MNVEKLIEEVRSFPVLYDQSNPKYRDYVYKENIWNSIAENLDLDVAGGVDECKRRWTSIRDQLRRTILKRTTKFGKGKNHKYKYEDELNFLLPHLGDRDGIPIMLKSKDHEANDEYESVDCKREDFTEVNCSEQTEDEEPISDEESIPASTRDNSLWSATQSSSRVSVNEEKFVRPKPLKRKIGRPEEISQDPSSHQLIAYILAEIEADKKRVKQDPVDAFLCGIAASLKSLNPHLLNEAKGRIFAVAQEMELRQLQTDSGGQRFIMPTMPVATQPSE